MSLFEIIILALIQGLTEFLPISSSAHLILPSEVLGWQNQGLAFDVAVHVGSLLAVVLYFRKDLLLLTQGFLLRGFTRNQTSQSILAWWLVIGTLPGVVFGYSLKDFIELYARNAWIIATTTIVFGLLLWYADKTAKSVKRLENITLKETLWIGLAQAVAIIPGTSRSGITITAALLCGIDKVSAARFSFLLSIPIIAGAGLLSVIELLDQVATVDIRALVYGALFSFIAAYACITLFLSVIAKLGMTPFVIYRLLLGFGLLGFLIMTQ